MRIDAREAALVVAGAAALVLGIYAATPLTPRNAGFDSDGLFYGAMALSLPELHELAHTAPYCWRPLTPWLAGALPRSDNAQLIANFRMLTLPATFASLLLLYALLRALRLPVSAAALGGALYAGLFWTLKFAYYSPAYVDYFAQTLLLAALLLTALGKPWLTLGVLCAGVFQRETILAAIPALIALRWQATRLRTGQERVWAGAVLALPLVLLAALRAFITPVNSYSSVAALAEVAAAQLRSAQFWSLLPVELAVGLGAIPLVALAAAHALPDTLRRLWPFAILLACGVPLAFGGPDKARLLLPLVPAAIVLAIAAFDAAIRDWRRPALIAWLALLLASHGYIGHQFEPLDSTDKFFQRLAPLHGFRDSGDPMREYLRCGAALGLVAIAAPLLLRRARRARPKP